MTIRTGQDAISNPTPALTLALNLLTSFGFTPDPISTSSNSPFGLGGSAVTAAPLQEYRPGMSCVPMTIVIDRSGLVFITSPQTGFSASFQAEVGNPSPATVPCRCDLECVGPCDVEVA